MRSASARSLLLGRDDEATKRWGVVTVSLFFFVTSLFAAIDVLDYPEFHAVLWWEGYAGLLVFLVAVQAYLNDGLLVSWALAAVAVAGVMLNLGGICLGAHGPPGPARLAVLSITGGVTLGTVGFVLGALARRLRARFA